MLKNAVFLILLIPAVCFAWSKQGHEYIARAAFESLPEPEQKYFAALLKQASFNKASSRLSAADNMAYYGQWPDRNRDKSLTQLFQRYGSGSVPKALRALSEEDTRAWHYSNEIFWSLDQKVVIECGAQNTGQLFSVWPKLIQAFQDGNKANDKLILLSFILHMAADAYQPLHTVAGVDKHCRHDRGGNLFCIKQVKGFSTGPNGRYKKCDENLHRLWDNGFAYFDQKKLANKASVFKGNIHSLQHTLLINQEHLAQIYSEPGTILSNKYRSSGQRIVSIQVEQAIQFLNAVLKALSVNQS